MAASDFYKILEIDRKASGKEIKAAFRRLALFYHPDKVAGLGEAARRQAEKKMKAITEAFSILENPEKRKLYDHCIDNGLDFTMEYSRARTETAKDKEIRKKKSETRKYMLQAATTVLKQNIVLLINDPKLREDSSDEYFDFILRGKSRGNRYLVHIKARDEFHPADLDSIIQYAETANLEGRTLLMRDHFSFVILALKFKEDFKIREAVKKYNKKMMEVKRGEPRRGIVLVQASRSSPFVPHGQYLQPDFGSLQLNLI